MIKHDILIHDIPFKLRVKKHRNDAGKLTLGVTLRPKFKLTGTCSKNMSFHYFTNGNVSRYVSIDQKGHECGDTKLTLREAKFRVIKYLTTEFKIQ